MNSTERVREAIGNTDPKYWNELLAMRAGESDKAQGSIVENLSPKELAATLMYVDWVPYTHPAIRPGASAFTTNLCGRLGLVTLSTLSEDTPVYLEDTKETGFYSATVIGVPGDLVDFTVMIIGPDEEQPKGRRRPIESVWTFHPGEPVRPSTLQISAFALKNESISIGLAQWLGFDLAKVRRK